MLLGYLRLEGCAGGRLPVRTVQERDGLRLVQLVAAKYSAKHNPRLNIGIRTTLVFRQRGPYDTVPVGSDRCKIVALSPYPKSSS
jgi:hypothetical protein